MSDSIALAERLNQECECVGTDVPALRRDLDAVLGTRGFTTPIGVTHTHLFSEAPVFIEPTHVNAMQRIIDAIEATTKLPAFAEAVVHAAPTIAHRTRPNPGVFLGFDFHISADGPKLIEINTNAGGALLNVAAQRVQRACCTQANDYLTPQPSANQLEDEIFEMFLSEWRLARGDRPLRTIAIVDDDPHQQFLQPEFLLFQRLFESRGVEAHIVDARDFNVSQQSVTLAGKAIDVVYNRLTDFYLADPRHVALRSAYESDFVVVTPHPHAHALYSNKRNLALLTNPTELRAMGLIEEHLETLIHGIPRTVSVEGDEVQWWRDRKSWFFKPAHGFGSRGAYRGDKITRRAFAEVMRGKYIAQELTPPGERRRTRGIDTQAFKFDVRNYVYAGKTQLQAARLYQGQTTNFRTAGGGFAPIYVLESNGTPLEVLWNRGS
jgi:hypothetical protein